LSLFFVAFTGGASFLWLLFDVFNFHQDLEIKKASVCASLFLEEEESMTTPPPGHICQKPRSKYFRWFKRQPHVQNTSLGGETSRHFTINGRRAATRA